MFRFDGEVFLLGTAIAAPLNACSTTIKIATICASSQRACRWVGSRRRRWIVANRGPYSGSGRCCKLSVAMQGRRGGLAMSPVPVTLAAAASCVLLNNWLGMRIARLRRDFRVNVGDGGHEPLLRRMRAQANFIEHAPFVLIMLGALELSGANRLALTALAGIFIVAR